MNQVQLVGNIAKDINLREGTVNTAHFIVACSRRVKREGQPAADFIDCVAFGKVAELVNKWFCKGKKIGVTGHIQTGNYINKDGQRIYTTEVIVETVEFVESKSASQDSAPDTGNNQETTQIAAPKAAEKAPAAEQFMQIPDDAEIELPFS